MTKMQGLDRLRRRLAAMPPSVRQAQAEELDQIADEHVDEMKRIAPKDEGKLAGSVRKQYGPTRAGEARVEISIGGPEAPYVAKVEFGHKAADGSHVPAEPFVYPVVRARRAATKARLRKRARDAIKKVIR